MIVTADCVNQSNPTNLVNPVKHKPLQCLIASNKGYDKRRLALDRALRQPHHNVIL